MSDRGPQCDVLILGAGMAGLTCARALAERGLRVTVLEAKPRVGGRVMTFEAHGGVVEVGAEFVHGRAPELWALIDEAGLETVEREGSMLRSMADGCVEEDDAQDGAMFEPLEELKDFTGSDVSFAEWLKDSEVPEEERPSLVGYVEGFNAADAARIGVRGLGAQQTAEDATEGDRAWHVREGYARLPEYLAERVKKLRGEILLSEEIHTVEWEPGRVTVSTMMNTFAAKRCVVALPLGVLQGDAVVIRPEPAAMVAARRLAMGHVVRFTCVFRHRWWESVTMDASRAALQGMSFLFTPQHVPPVWWTPQPEESVAMLTGWVGGPRSEKLQGKTKEQIGEVACRVLAAVFGVAEEFVRGELLWVYTRDWSADPFSLGAYSYVPAGALDAPQAMTVPEDDTLFFAGEHTDVSGHWGTVHAAMRSGLRAAEQVLGEASS